MLSPDSEWGWLRERKRGETLNWHPRRSTTLKVHTPTGRRSLNLNASKHWNMTEHLSELTWWDSISRLTGRWSNIALFLNEEWLWQPLFFPPHPLFSAASSPSWSRLFEARGGQEFQELAVVWHEAWKKPENKTKGGNGGEVRRGEGKEAGLPGQHVMTKGWRGGGLQKGKGRVGKGGVRGKYRQENERYTGKNLYKE